jgi:hypothetical protein
VHDVDPKLFVDSNSDSRSGALSKGPNRIVVVGARDAERASDGKIYSRALQANTAHYYQVTCGSAVASGTFTTKNIPLGMTYTDLPQADPDNPGATITPTLPTDVSTPVIDPHTGALLKNLSLDSADGMHGVFLDYGGGTKHCAFQLVGPGPGFLCSFPSSGSNYTSDGGALNILYYIIPSTGETRYLGIFSIPGASGPAGYPAVYGMGGTARFNDTSVFFTVGDNSGGLALLKGTYVGDYKAVPPGRTPANFSWTNITPYPNDTYSLMEKFDSTFHPADFNGCNFMANDSYGLLTCLRGTQDSYGIFFCGRSHRGIPEDHCREQPLSKRTHSLVRYP